MAEEWKQQNSSKRGEVVAVERLETLRCSGGANPKGANHVNFMYYHRRHTLILASRLLLCHVNVYAIVKFLFGIFIWPLKVCTTINSYRNIRQWLVTGVVLL
jgi:hypothetical protein